MRENKDMTHDDVMEMLRSVPGVVEHERWVRVVRDRVEALGVEPGLAYEMVVRTIMTLDEHPDLQVLKIDTGEGFVEVDVPYVFRKEIEGE